LPLFRRSGPEADADGYVSTVPAVDVVEGAPVTVSVAGESILLVRLGDEIMAVARYCPHAAGDFAKGEQVRHKLICPEHDYSFDLRSGRILWPADESYCLKHFAVRVRDGMVAVGPQSAR
jgi:nitrite reductase/ring-hydroxylating ferredoxin subunit